MVGNAEVLDNPSALSQRRVRIDHIDAESSERSSQQWPNMLLKHTHIRTEPVLISIRSPTIHSRARGSRDDNDSLAGLIVTFFSGICLEQNLGPRPGANYEEDRRLHAADSRNLIVK
jgi:hypothetical protein